MGKITKKLIADYDNASAFVHGKVPLGSPEWIAEYSYVENMDRDEIVDEWDFGANDSISVEDYSVSLNHVMGDDPYHDDTLIIDVNVKQVFGEEEPFTSDEEREEYISKYRYVGHRPGEKTVHIEVPVSDLSSDELGGLIEQMAKGACERPNM